MRSCGSKQAVLFDRGRLQKETAGARVVDVVFGSLSGAALKASGKDREWRKPFRVKASAQSTGNSTHIQSYILCGFLSSVFLLYFKSQIMNYNFLLAGKEMFELHILLSDKNSIKQIRYDVEISKWARTSFQFFCCIQYLYTKILTWVYCLTSIITLGLRNA